MDDGWHLEDYSRLKTSAAQSHWGTKMRRSSLKGSERTVPESQQVRKIQCKCVWKKVWTGNLTLYRSLRISMKQAPQEDPRHYMGWIQNQPRGKKELLNSTDQMSSVQKCGNIMTTCWEWTKRRPKAALFWRLRRQRRGRWKTVLRKDSSLREEKQT